MPIFLKRLIVLLMVVTFNFVPAQDKVKDSTAKTNRIWKDLKYDGRNFVRGFANTFTQPTRWKKKDFLTAASIVAGSSILYISDTETNDYFREQGEDAPEFIRDFGWYFGSPQNFFLVSAGIYGFGLLTDNEKVRYTGVLIITSAASAGLIQSLSKTLVGRSRPNFGPKNEFKIWSHEADRHSFPSGHSVLSFAMAHAIAKQFKSIWIKAGIYAVGAIAPISRLWDNAHWLSDIGLGVALSVVVVDGVDNFLRKRKQYGLDQKHKISWRFTAGYRTVGLTGTF